VILRDVSARQRAEHALAERLRLEQLVTQLAIAFGHLSTTELDREIQRGLRAAADFLEVDRGSLMEFSPDGKVARCWAIEEWMDAGHFPWMTAGLQRGDFVMVSRLDELPDEAAVDRQSYLTYRVKPQVAVPLEAGGRVVGGLVFSTLSAERAMSDELKQQLHALGQVFANLLSRKQAEFELQRLRQDLAHVSRVATVGELTTTLSHELAQPLTAILSNAQAAQSALKVDPVDLGEIREILQDIVEDDKRAGAVIHGLRALLKKGTPEFTDLDVNDLVAEVAGLVSSEVAHRHVSLRLELAPRLPRVRGDRVQLQQVVLNLVLNGLDAMQESVAGGRTLVLRTAEESSAAVRVAARDFGAGIDAADLDHIFQAFYTTKTDGLGMGLAIARSIVDAHGGRLEAENNPDGGATFSFTLPVKRDMEAADLE
jgi:signal transduction histidine kinase